MADITSSNITSTSIAVSWSGLESATYPSVRVDMFLTSDFANLKPGQLPPTARKTLGEIVKSDGSLVPSVPPIGTDTGAPLPFTGLTAATSYRFALYGWTDGSEGAALPIFQAVSQPFSTLAAKAPPPKTPPSVGYPDIFPQPYPKTLNNTNYVLVTLQNPNLWVQWYVTLDGVPDHNSIAPTGNYRFESSPGEAHRVIGSGNPVGGGAYIDSPFKLSIGTANYHSVSEFLAASGVSGTNGIRQYVSSSKSTSVRDMLGIKLG
jgi:hypothetical protein